MKSILFKFTCALLLLAPLGGNAQSVFADGREWRQVNATIGPSNSFFDLYMACGVNAGVCGGGLAGWTWATNSEVQSLWESLTGVTGLGTSIQTGVSTTWATTILSNFSRTGTTIFGDQMLWGWTRAENSIGVDADLAYVSRTGAAFNNGNTFDSAQFLDDFIGPPGTQVGIWLYASAGPVTAPIPEPETYAMLLAGLGLLGFVARRRRLELAARGRPEQG